MNQSKVKNKEVFENLATIYLEKKQQIEEIKKEMNILKEEILGLFDEQGIKSVNTEKGRISVQYPKSFDTGLFGVEFPDLYKKYTTIEKVITEKVVVNKEDLQRFYPEEYKKCTVELTPRLIIQFL